MANDWSRMIGFLCCMLPLMIILVRIIWVWTTVIENSGCLSQGAEDRIRSIERDVEFLNKKWNYMGRS